MEIGIFARTFPGTDPMTVLGAAAATGYAGVQYNMACSGLPSMPDVVPADSAAAVAAASAATGQRIFALSATYNMAHPDAEVRAAGLDRLAVLAEAAPRIGTRLLTLCTGSRDPDDQWRHHPDNGSAAAWSDMRRSVEAAIEIAGRHDLLLGVEPELANVVNSARAARRLIDETGSSRIRIVLDPANLFETASAAGQRRLIEEAVDLLGDRIVMAHAKDRDAAGGFATAGKGVVDFGHFLGVLKAAGFDGPLVTHGLAAGEAADVAVFLKAAIEALP